MTRKAKLDILEIHPEERPADPEPVLSAEREAESPQPQPPRFRLHRKMIVLCALILIVCSTAGGSLLFWLRSGKEAASPPDRRSAPAVLATTGGHVVALNNFVIDYREQGDRVRIVVFALAVELDRSVRKDALDQQPELRGDIYSLSKKRSLDSLRGPDERGALKNEIAAELEKRLGAGAVKAVYFTQFTIM